LQTSLTSKLIAELTAWVTFSPELMTYKAKSYKDWVFVVIILNKQASFTIGDVVIDPVIQLVF